MQASCYGPILPSILKLSASALDYEVGQSKQCIHQHRGFYPTFFLSLRSRGWDNVTVINSIAKYYDLSIGRCVIGPMFLHCYGWKMNQLPQEMQQQRLQPSNQNDCRACSANRTPIVIIAILVVSR